MFQAGLMSPAFFSGEMPIAPAIHAASIISQISRSVEGIVRSSGCICLMLGVLLVAVPLPSQNANPMHPEEIQVQHHASPEEIRDRLGRPQLQKDAKDLAELCASVPADMDGIKQGLLRKDVLEKLKRMEKLSKRMREELTQASTAP